MFQSISQELGRDGELTFTEKVHRDCSVDQD